MESKTKRQEEFAAKWRHSSDYGASKNGSGTFWAVTGFGKTYGTIQQIIKPFLEKASSNYITILVAREIHYQHWISELDIHLKVVNDRKRVKVVTVQYLIKNDLRLATNLLIVDELHKFYGEEYIQYVNGNLIQFTYNLGLTATFRDPRGRHKKLMDLYYPIDVITQEEALEKGWISQFVEYNVGINLSKDEIKEYKSYQDAISKHLPKFGDAGTRAAFLCHRGGKGRNGRTQTAEQWCMQYALHMGWRPDIEKSHSINALWNPAKIRGYARQVVENLKNINDFLYNNKSKYEVAMTILRKFNDKKIMTFGQSTKFADDLAEQFNVEELGNAVSYHTQLKSRPLKNQHGEYIRYKSGKRAGEVKKFGLTSLKKMIINAFVTGTANVLCTASAMDENFDCPDIEVGLITARTSNPNKQLQRGGRIKRILPKDPNAIMLIINLYCKNTKDYDWLRISQGKNEHIVKWVEDIDDIEFAKYEGETYDITDI
jgi:superfamily II DNA or RNA helicase